MGAHAFRKTVQIGAITWAGLILMGWVWYLSFVDGALAGFHWLAFAYSRLGLPSSLMLFGLIACILPYVGVVFALWLVSNFLNPDLKQVTRQITKYLLIVLCVYTMVLMATVPTAFAGYFPRYRESISSWNQTFHGVYIAPTFDWNYGDLMLLQCDRPGVCHQVYRAENQAVPLSRTSGIDAFTYDATTDRIGFRHNQRWIYVGDRSGELCSADPDTFDDGCQFEAFSSR